LPDKFKSRSIVIEAREVDTEQELTNIFTSLLAPSSHRMPARPMGHASGDGLKARPA
jgi:hypothetical protein